MGVFRSILLSALAASASARAEGPDVARLTKAAQAGHAYDRGAAIAALGSSKDPKAIPVLAAILKSGQGGLRFQALEALAVLGDRKALLELLPPLLDDPNPSIRERAAAALAGQWKTRDAAEIKILVAAFTKSLEDEYQVVRRAAAVGLLKMPSSDAKKTLAGAVSNSDLFVRQQALKLLVRHVQPETLPHLKKLCRSENPQTRMSSLKALVRHKTPEVLTVLKNAVSDETVQVRELAVRLAAGSMKDAEISDTIARLLAEDPNAKVRAAAAEALRAAGPDAQGALIGAGLYADEDLTVRLKALSSLGAVGDRQCLPFLETLSEDANKKLLEGAENARRAIRARASKLEPPEQPANAGSEVLDRLLAVHESRLAVLGRNTRDGRGRPSYEGVYESLLERMGDADRFVSRAARKAAVQLLELAAGKDRKLLLKILKHPELDLRIAAMKAISRSLGTDAHPILVKALKERHEGTRAAAVEQIRKLAEQKTELSKAVIQALLKALKDSSEEVRYQARGALRALAGQDYRFDADRWKDWYLSRSERGAKELALHPVPGVLREEVSFEPVGKLLLPFGSPRDVIVRGNWAYVATGEGGVALYDLSKPETPRLADRYVTRVPGHVTEGHGWARYANGVCNQIAAVGDRLYLRASHSGFATSGVELTVLDISKPDRLRFMGSLPPGSGSHAHGVIAAAGNLVYSVQGKKRMSLVIYDFTDAQRPRQAGSYKARKSISAIAASGKFVVVGQSAAGLRVIEVNEPDSPQARDFHPIAGKISSVLIHGGQVAIGTDKNELHLLKLETVGILVDQRKVPLDSPVAALAGGPKRIYLSTQAGVRVLDISKPAQPKLLPSGAPFKGMRLAAWRDGVAVADPTFGLRLLAPDKGTWKTRGEVLGVGKAGDLEIRDGWAFVAAGQAGLLVVDLRKPEKPELYARLPLDGYAHRINLRGNQAFVSAGSGGMAVVDVTDPAKPRLAGRLSTLVLAQMEGSSLLRNREIRNWPSLCKKLTGTATAPVKKAPAKKVPEKKAPDPAQLVGKLLPQKTLKLAGEIAQTSIFDKPAQVEILAALNDLLKRPDLHQQAPFKTLVLGEVKGIPQEFKNLLADKETKELSAGEVQRRNRVLLEAVFQGEIAKSLFYGAQVRDVFWAGNMAYLAVDPAGLVIVDLSAPTNPKALGEFRANSDERARARAVEVQRGIAYLAVGRAGLYVIDVSDPLKPKKLSWYWDHEVYRRMATWDVRVKGDLVYLADADLGLLIVDVSRPDAPRLAGRIKSGNTHQFVMRGPNAILADGGYGLRAIDVADPAQPRSRGSFHGRRLQFESLRYLDDNTLAVAGAWELQTFRIGSRKIPLRTAFSINKYGTPQPMLRRDGRPVAAEDVSRRYGIDFTLFDGGQDVCSDEGYPDRNSPGHRIRPVYQELSDAAGWPNTKVKVGTVAVDPIRGRVKFADGDPDPSRIMGWAPLPMGICHTLRKSGNHVFMSDEEGWNIVIWDVSDPFKPVRTSLACTGGFCIGSLWVHNNLVIGGNNLGRFTIFDISNIEKPVPVGWFPGYARCVAASGNYAFDIAGNLRVWDITDPSQPQKVADVPKTMGFSMSGTHANPGVIATDKYLIGGHGSKLKVIDLTDMPNLKVIADHPIRLTCLALDGDRLYTGDGRTIQIFDFSDPVKPVLLGRCAVPTHFRAIAAEDGYVYTSGYSLQVVDCTDPASPRFIGSCRQFNYITGNTPQNVVYGIVANGNAVYTAQPGWGLSMFDVTDKANPKPLLGDTMQTLAMGGDFTGIAARGNYAFSANNWSGVHVVDISNPSRPKRIFSTKHHDSGAALGIAANDDLFIYNSSVTGDMIFDYSDPKNVRDVGRPPPHPHPPPGWGIAGGAYMCIRGNYAYGGGKVLDITYPLKKKVVAHFPGALKTGVAGNYYFDSRSVIDITRPDRPKVLSSGSTAFHGGAPWYGRGFFATERAVYSASRIALLITDVSDPSRPRLASHQALPHLVCDVSVQGSFAYVSTYYGGVDILDISDLSRPKLVDHFEHAPFWDFGGWDNLCCYQGAAIDGEYLVANEYYSGLHVIDVPTKPHMPQKLTARVYVKK